MLSIQPYLNFPGNTEEAFNFYSSVFGTKISAIIRFKDNEETNKGSAEDLDKIMHISLPLTKNTTLMATDALESMGQKLNFGNNFYLMIEAESEDEANTLFEKLSVGGDPEMPMSKTFWGAYFGSLIDKFEMRWMINYTYDNNQ
jgi:PhnB protein